MPTGLNSSKIVKKLARHYFHDADLLYEIFANDDIYLKDTVRATCQITADDFARIEQAVTEAYQGRLARLREQIQHQRQLQRKEEKKTPGV